MCIRPPCENCGADYDACMSVCPKCGHPNSYAMPPTKINVKVKEHKVWCKVCETYHTVTEFETTDEETGEYVFVCG